MVKQFLFLGSGGFDKGQRRSTAAGTVSAMRATKIEERGEEEEEKWQKGLSVWIFLGPYPQSKSRAAG